MKAPNGIKGYAKGGKTEVKGDPKKTPKQWDEENLKAGRKLIPYTTTGAAPSVYKEYYDPKNYPDASKLTGIGEGSINVNDLFSYKVPLNDSPQNAVVSPISNRTFLANDANGNTTYKDNSTGQTYTLDKAGNNIGIVQQFKGGGKVMKAPKGIKCYADGGTITPEEQNQGFYIRNGVKYNQAGVPVMDSYNPTITSANNSLNTGGTEFQTQGDVPLTTQKLDATGQPTKQPSQNEMKTRGVANMAGQALGAYGSGYYATKENTSTGDTARSGIMGAVGRTGAIGGAVAGLAAIGDQIGKPIREKSEKVDTSGELVNEDKAKKNAMIGVTLSPSKRLTYKGGLTDVSGKAYLKSIEDPYKSQIEEEKKVASQNQLNDALAARERGEVGYTAINKYKPHEFAQGGKIVGKGTAKSDDIDAKIKGNSFVVPEENSKMAETIRKVVLKKAPSVKAKLNQKGGENVKLSNGEHLFTPSEVEKIENKLGDDVLDKLAPNSAKHEDMMEGEYSEMEKEHMKDGGLLSAEKARMILHDKMANGKPLTDKQRKFMGWVAGGRKAEGGMVNGYADGGKIPEGTKLGQYYYRNGKWSDSKGNVLTKEFGQKYTDAYNKQVNNAPTKTGAELEKVSKPTLKAPSVKKVVAKADNGITNENYVSPQDLALLEQMKKPTATVPINTGSGVVNSVKQETATTPQTNTDKGKSWKAWSPMFGNVLGNAVEVGASLAQIKLGRDALKKAGERPIGEIDPTFQANVDRAQAQSKYGFSAEQNALLAQENQNATNAARFAARNFSGGSGGNAFNMERSAINEGWGRGLKAKIADQNLMLDKQQTANQLSLQKAGMSRQLFEDKLGAWNQDEMAAAGLKNQGWRNIIGASRYANALNSIQQQNQLGQ